LTTCPDTGGDDDQVVDEDESHIGALAMYAPDNKGQNKLIKWLTKICAKRPVTQKLLPVFLSRLLKEEVVTQESILLFYKACEDEAALSAVAEYIGELSSPP